MFATELLQLTTEGNSKTIAFIVTPDMEWPLVLELTAEEMESEGGLD